MNSKIDKIEKEMKEGKHQGIPDKQANAEEDNQQKEEASEDDDEEGEDEE